MNESESEKETKLQDEHYGYIHDSIRSELT